MVRVGVRVSAAAWRGGRTPVWLGPAEQLMKLCVGTVPQATAAGASTACGRSRCWRMAPWRAATRAAAWRSGTRARAAAESLQSSLCTSHCELLHAGDGSGREHCVWAVAVLADGTMASGAAGGGAALWDARQSGCRKPAKQLVHLTL